MKFTGQSNRITKIRFRWLFVTLAALLLIGGIGLNFWAWSVSGLPAAGPIVKLQTNPSFPPPQVLHFSTLSLPGVTLAVPFQAGGYEISRVLPGELTVYYQATGSPSEARVAFFPQPLKERLRMLAPFPGSWLLNEDWSPAQVLQVLRTTRQPSLKTRIAAWRLLDWIGRRQIQAEMIAESGGGRMSHLWKWSRGPLTAIGREYVSPATGRQWVATTLFQDQRIFDVCFSFSQPLSDNHALIRAWLESIRATGNAKADNESGLAECQQLGAGGPAEQAIRLCRELYLVAIWQNNGYDFATAMRLLDLYTAADDAVGLRALKDQLTIAENAGSPVGDLRDRIDRQLVDLANEKNSTGGPTTPAAENEGNDE